MIRDQAGISYDIIIKSKIVTTIAELEKVGKYNIPVMSLWSED